MENYSRKKFSLINSLKLNNINETRNQTNDADDEHRYKPQLPLLNALRNQLAESFAYPKESVNSFKNNALTNPNQHQDKNQKELKLRDFEILEKISLIELESIELQYLKKLYMLHPKNTNCLLYRIQKKQDSYFDGTNYTDTMQIIFHDSYQLPCLIKRYDSNDKVKNLSEEPYDELFLWSLLLYSGSNTDLKLARHFWSKSKYPISCCLIGIIAFKNLLSENFLPEELKENMNNVIKEFENMAVGVFGKCAETNLLISQDLLIYEKDIFYNHTVLELAIRAKAYDIIGMSPLQELLTDVWFDKINPHIPNWQIILPYFFIPCIFLPISYFRSDNIELINLTELNEKASKISIKSYSRNTVYPLESQKSKANEKFLNEQSFSSEILNEFQKLENVPNQELSYRNTSFKLNGLYRIYFYFNAPIIKFLNHFIFYVIFLFLFSGFLLFDYYPDKEVSSTVIRITIKDKKDFIKVTATELTVIICVFIYLTDEIRQLIIKKTSDKRLLSKIKSFYLENKWNIFDFFLYLIFFVAFGIRFSPVFGDVFYIGHESCYEIARVLYCIDSILWYTKIFEMVSCVPFWGPKILIIKEMIKKLIVYVMLILVFIIPFSASVETILNKTQNFSIGVLTNALNRTFWIMFGELLDILQEFEKFQCRGEIIDNFSTKNCGHSLASFFLFIGFAFYTIACNLLILNMIIATFTSTVEEIDINSNKYFKFLRHDGIKEFYQRSMIPPPFIVLEYLYILLTYIRGYFTGNYPEKNNEFRIENMEENIKNAYIKFETYHRNKFYDENYVKPKEEKKAELYRQQSISCSDSIIQSLNKIEENMNLFKIWILEQQNEKFNNLNKTLENLFSKLEK